MRVLPALLTLALLAGCAHGAPTSSVRQAHGTEASNLMPAPDMNLMVNPDVAQERATKKAKEWASDSRLIGVGWALAKFELTSVVFHIFQSNKQGKLLIVESKLVSFWQKTREISDKKITWPARLLDTLDEDYVSAKDALEEAKRHLPEGQDRPVAFMVMWKPNRFLPALYGVKADQEKVLIHAKSGKTVVHTDISIPMWPFKGALTDEVAEEPAS
jgi:hypothetical protein